MAITSKNKSFLTLYGRKGKAYKGLSPLVKDSPGEAGSPVFDDWMLDAAVAGGNTATLTVFSGDSMAAFVATPVSAGTNATINGAGDDGTGASVATVATNATASGSDSGNAGALVASVATSSAMGGISGDSLGAFVATPVSPGTDATVSGAGDDASGAFVATVSANATVSALSGGATGAVLANIAANATIDGAGDGGSATATAGIATAATVSAFDGDSAAEIVAAPVSPGTNAAITGYGDGSFASLMAQAAQQAIVSGGGYAFDYKAEGKRKRREQDDIRAAIRAAFDGEELPIAEVAKVEDDIVRQVLARDFDSEIYAAILARDLAQLRLEAMLEEQEDEDFLMMV